MYDHFMSVRELFFVFQIHAPENCLKQTFAVQLKDLDLSHLQTSKFYISLEVLQKEPWQSNFIKCIN